MENETTMGYIGEIVNIVLYTGNNEPIHFNECKLIQFNIYRM